MYLVLSFDTKVVLHKYLVYLLHVYEKMAFKRTNTG